MKALIFCATLFAASSSFAFTTCDKWANNARLTKAIYTVAAHEDYTFEELCTLPKILDVEAQPSHIVERDGTVIPHVRVQLHMEYSSCLYMVRDSDQVITSSRCYSGW
ncbi:hypothetical protein [Bdellovibrio sp. NC01]|uniref:hypothetical protein n=1 Tax=Bdellovibrio sp. NC01 TaxID=2220073 RepID=UPI001159EDB1|nr:hypothetical protein [Bdellovibrio sp. NC01]QDK38567.1 hypothetical protein DOE51_13755 [Bdellovibrio sp. NC01]